ncbi:hypothetical protein GCM10023107_06410 [Actinoplanes octamycinicus]|nr:hypothetical protein Aoc01nite_07990 [Actinoplanes octamycinicus]
MTGQLRADIRRGRRPVVCSPGAGRFSAGIREGWEGRAVARRDMRLLGLGASPLGSARAGRACGGAVAGRALRLLGQASPPGGTCGGAIAERWPPFAGQGESVG